MTEELYDVLDEQGNKTGKALPKSMVHDQELWHGTTFIWIYNSKGELLVQFRAADKKLYANVWDVSVAGHMTAGDDALTTAIREAKEELGLKVEAKDLSLLGHYTDAAMMITGKMHREHDYMFLLKADIPAEQLKLQQSEVLNAKWIPTKQLQAELYKLDWKKHYAGRNKQIYEMAITAVLKNPKQPQPQNLESD